MSRWSSRFRRAAAVLVGLQLWQVVLLAASAACDLSNGDVPHHASASDVVAAADAAVVAASAPMPHSDHRAAHAPAGEPSPDAPHHTTHTTSCPMAMACAVTAVVVAVPVVESRELHVGTARIGHDAPMLFSLHHTPEPPPPRG